MFVFCSSQEPVKKLVSVVWTFFEPLLFGLIGAEVTLKYLTPSLVGKWVLIYGTYWYNLGMKYIAADQSEGLCEGIFNIYFNAWVQGSNSAIFVFPQNIF